MKFLSGWNPALLTIDSAAIADLKKEEGSNIVDGWHVAYQDHLGVWTAGYGRNLQTARFTEAEAERWLREDYASALKKAQQIPVYAKLSKNRKRVLTAMVYQIGYNGVLKFRNMLSALSRGDYEQAAVEMLKSQWAQQTPARARRMAVRMRLDTWPP